MKKPIVLIAILIGFSFCNKKATFDEFLLKFNDVAVFNPELYKELNVSTLQEIDKATFKEYVKNVSLSGVDTSSELTFYAVEKLKIDATFYALSIAIRHKVKDKTETSVLMVSITKDGSVIVQTPLYGVWGYEFFHLKKMNEITVDNETKKFSGVEFNVDISRLNDDETEYVFQGTAVKYLQGEGNIIQLEFFDPSGEAEVEGDEDFEEGEFVANPNRLAEILKGLPMKYYPLDVNIQNSSCSEEFIYLSDFGIQDGNAYNACYQLPTSFDFYILIMRSVEGRLEETSTYVFSFSKQGKLIDYVKIAWYETDGDPSVLAKTSFTKENEFTIVEERETGGHTKLLTSKYKFLESGKLDKYSVTES